MIAFLARFLRPETGFFFFAWFTFLIAFRDKAFFDPGSLWHIVVGDLILDHGFMHTDPFTYTHEGQTWIPQQWGGEVLISLVHRFSGFDGILLGFATLLASLWTWVFARMRANGMAAPLAAAVTAVAAVAGAFHFFVRPHLATMFFLGWTMGCLVDYDRGRVSLWRLAGLIPLYVLWTNLHGGVLGGVMTLGLAVVGWLGGWVVGWLGGWEETESSRTAIRRFLLLSAIVLACLLTPFINPFGMEMINTWQRIVGSTVLPKVVNEHKPLNPTTPAGMAVLGLAAGYILLLLGSWPTRPRVTWFLPLVWFVLTLKGIRQGPLFAITAAVTIADIWPQTIWYRLLLKHGDTLATEPNPTASPGWRAFVLPALAVLAALGVQRANIEAPVVGRGWAYLNHEMIPVELIDPIRERIAAAGPGVRIVNDCNLGGFLIYHFRGTKIFMDDRFELFGDAWTADYADKIEKQPSVIDEWADKYGATLAVVMATKDEEDDPPVAKYLKSSTRWRQVARAERGLLFERVK